MAVKENSPKKCCNGANKNYEQGYCHDLSSWQNNTEMKNEVVQLRSVKEKSEPSEK